MQKFDKKVMSFSKGVHKDLETAKKELVFIKEWGSQMAE